MSILEAVIRVGAGRGFIVAGRDERLIITAAHCLPFLPPCASFSHGSERTYENLLGSTIRGKIWAECLFVDPIGDIAVLGPPDAQDLSDQHNAYVAFVDAAECGKMADIPPCQKHSVRLLGLNGQWFAADVQHLGGPLWISDARSEIVGGMSGSPIIDAEDRSIGVLCCSASIDGASAKGGGPNPRLFYNLPRWIIDGASA